ncbi:MAG TPA: hypothetical protein DCL21_03625 [Alphaproteobacteria bacterium]|nr:hypothetical protein [Alphaproteobacteria bacterium]
MAGQLITYLFILFAIFGFSGCATGVVATGAGAAYVANQENTLTQQAKDIHIKANLKDKLLQKDFGYLKNVEINVVNGEVLLLGVVDTMREKRRIQEEAVSSKYVRKVFNNIMVDSRYSVSSYLNDSLIANVIRTRMIASEKTYLSKLNVEVFKNVVYVFGIVGSNQEKLEAEKIARTGKGVRRVYSFIRIKHG